MKIEEAREKIRKIFGEAKRHQDWGGDEDMDGELHAGFVDMRELEKEVFEILENIDV